MAILSLLNFIHPERYLAFLTLIPFIIVYLIRPKPKSMQFPSLQFLFRDKGVLVKTSFFRSLLRNLLFLIQLFIFLLLAVSIIEPTTKISYDASAENTVIVLDISASMQVGNRFNNAITIAKKNLDGKVSIILAGSLPLLVLQDESSEKALAFLSALKSKDVTTNLGDAINLAGEILADKEGKVLVISDFLVTDGPDPQVALQLLRKRGIFVDFVSVFSPANNVGFINAFVDNHETRLVIKNYNDESKTVSVKIKGQTKEKSFTVTLLPKSVESISFDTFADLANATILDKDGFMLDNSLYLLGPSIEKLQVLLITNKPSPFLKAAFQSFGNVHLEIAQPPLVPPITQDVIIFDSVEYNKLLPGTMNEIAKRVDQGTNVIILAQENMKFVDFANLLPVTILEMGNSATIKPAGENVLTKEVSFETVSKEILVKAHNDTLVLATDQNQNPMLAIKSFGEGHVFYYGIIDSLSDFKSSPSYPILWRNIVDYLAGGESVKSANTKTGILLPVKGVIETPLGKIQTATLELSSQGVYTLNNKRLAANLLSEKESDVSAVHSFNVSTASQYGKTVHEREKDIDLSLPFIFLALILLFIELYITKVRGDL